jgi:hypothetical protein
VAGSGGAAVPLQLGGRLKEFVEAPDLDPYRRIDGRQLVDVALRKIERYTPTEKSLLFVFIPRVEREEFVNVGAMWERSCHARPEDSSKPASNSMSNG